ncbi:hypothetical protein E6O75_ATG00065 [Venturia nashicola]|uniref:Uncharacterized protein n=1 Tax=Venturia nashicola TaxID=86259 RepID=A0A4Z1PSM6_9PEZI|nr:hypothetical protein E6O75_ATG00065 [Venturia nashicola]
MRTASRYRTFGRVTGLLSPHGERASGIFIAVVAVRTVERMTLPTTESPRSLFMVFVFFVGGGTKVVCAGTCAGGAKGCGGCCWAGGGEYGGSPGVVHELTDLDSWEEIHELDPAMKNNRGLVDLGRIDKQRIDIKRNATTTVISGKRQEINSIYRWIAHGINSKRDSSYFVRLFELVVSFHFQDMHQRISICCLLLALPAATLWVRSYAQQECHPNFAT